MLNRVCPQCGAPLLGRADKKYCSDDCRAEANRLKRRVAREPTFAINETLWRNREILRTLWKDRPTMVSRETLLVSGFRFEYLTGLHITITRNIYFICYDFGFHARMIAGSKMALVVKMNSVAVIDAWHPLFSDR